LARINAKQADLERLYESANGEPPDEIAAELIEIALRHFGRGCLLNRYLHDSYERLKDNPPELMLILARAQAADDAYERTLVKTLGLLPGTGARRKPDLRRIVQSTRAIDRAFDAPPDESLAEPGDQLAELGDK
jgi:hypothetical protein